MEHAALIALTAFTTTCFLLIAYYTLYPIDPQIIPSPLHIIPSLPEDEIQKLPYQPDFFPGARDVETEYGSIRVYEWGPETGPKVVLIHGMSTCTMTLGPIAKALVSRGCRVLLFDLFGRGFSDGVGDLPYDIRLYTTQVLLALASSPLSWTGSNSLRVIGYSLGGAIAASFAVDFPHMVSSLILLAPAGLIRSTDLGLTFWFLFKSGLVPKRVLHALMRVQLRSTTNSGAVKEQHCSPQETDKNPTDLWTASPSVNKLSLQEQVSAYMPWIVTHHRGFVPAFTSCARFSPLTHQHRVWLALGKRKVGSTAVIIGDADEVLNTMWYEKNGLPLLGGQERVMWKVLPGSHDFVMTAPELIMSEIDVFWGLHV
ncbi:Alpha/Beta hydrolase protein [Fusarium redolens]|uniref:Alpha/Beta hydrolase protein n=1 Tax=Fusarium redolens TaxID=48865 RepID=A0A9P9HPI4_FUSRE|nr:Alpha/Beta hydrolase protein [Fusarium redolens]KAH7260738.1 Alpha/Beta hydrolase protein [Fusarium redolens]